MDSNHDVVASALTTLLSDLIQYLKTITPLSLYISLSPPVFSFCRDYTVYPAMNSNRDQCADHGSTQSQPKFRRNLYFISQLSHAIKIMKAKVCSSIRGEDQEYDELNVYWSVWKQRKW